MKKQGCLGVLLLGLLICLGSTRANAQTSKFNLFGGYSYGTNNLDQNCDFGNCDDPGHHGYAVAFAYNFNNHIGLEANFSGHNGTSTEYMTPGSVSNNQFRENDVLEQDIYTYTFGPKLSQPVGNFVLFTHFLVGATHYHAGGSDICTVVGESGCFTNSYFKGSANGMAFRTGGGVDWNHGRWGIRILEVDYVHDQLYGTLTCTGGCSGTSSTPVSGGGVELSTGVTFNFGK